MKLYNLFIMKLFKSSFLLVFLLFACNNGTKKVTPSEAAQQQCECIKYIGGEKTEEAIKAFKECNTKLTNMIGDQKDDPEFMKQFQEELRAIVKDCHQPAPSAPETEKK